MGQKECTVAYPFPEHECALDSLRRATITERCWLLRRLWVRYCLVSERDVRARRLFRSYAEFVKEKRRQYDNFKYSIHPYSRMRFVWEIVVIVHYIFLAIHLPVSYSLHSPSSSCQWLMFVVDLITAMDLTLRFFTGYITGSVSERAVLDLKSIAINCLKGYFIVDLVALLSSVRVFTASVRWRALLLALKVVRGFTTMRYISNFMQVLNVGTLKATLAKVAVLTLLYMQQNILMQFITEYMAEDSYTPQTPRSCSWITMAKLWNSTRAVRYVYALDRAGRSEDNELYRLPGQGFGLDACTKWRQASNLSLWCVGMLRQNSNPYFQEKDCCDEYFVICAYLISKMLHIHCLFTIFMTTISCESSEVKYYLMTRQVKAFVRKKQLPPRFKRRIFEYYRVRYNSTFFAESHIMSCVSGQLREDIIMHTTGHLVKNVPFLQSLPRQLLVNLALNIRMEVFLAGDVIYRAGEPGECMYFIDKGTVAVFFVSGQEMWHLEDGDYFGETGFVLRPFTRKDIVVAVTNCELFRLEREHFEGSVEAYPDVMESVRRQAAKRIALMTKLDETRRGVWAEDYNAQ